MIKREKQRVTEIIRRSGSPQHFAPDGGFKIVSSSRNFGVLWQPPIDGDAPVQVTNFTTGRIFNFAFTSDGSRLALSRGAINNDVVLIENQK